jgi:hypothetical protein
MLKKHQSPEYMATVRRRKSGSLRSAITALAEHADREDFVICTYPVLKEINELLIHLACSETEGNSREILRQLRNTLLNGGWNRYRQPAVRRAAVAILTHLAEAEKVLPSLVDEAFEQLSRASLNPVGASLPEFSAEEAILDAQGQVPG